ncbi:MAG: AAA family ATPase [Candidatus Pacebacteria bacterium]|nr:AAA family ATPase [Candidatus Paceibacterota bacterium]
MFCRENFIGNRRVVNLLNKNLERGNISQAYLFEGPKHIGKTTLAIDLAVNLLEEDFETIYKNPDFISISPDPESGQIEADMIRGLQKDLSLFPFKSKYKIALIEEAQLMNSTAANALLKTLEEPGRTSLIILVSSDASNILETIRSRCQIVSFVAVGRKTLSDGIKLLGIDSKEKDEAVSFIETPGALINLFGNVEELSMHIEGGDKIKKILNGNHFDRLDVASLTGILDKKEMMNILDLWILVSRQKLRALMQDSRDGSGIKEIARLKNIIENIITVKEDIFGKNVNIKLAIDSLCLKF